MKPGKLQSSRIAAGTKPPIASPAPGARIATPPLAGDSLQRQAVPPKDLEQEAQAAQQLMGKPLSYTSQGELEAYLTTVRQSEPLADYDPKGFLVKQLKLGDVRASGRTDRPTLEALRKIPQYHPTNTLAGLPILPQRALFALAKASPSLFLALTKATNPAMEAISKAKAKWKKPFVSVQKASPTGLTPQQRYPGVLSSDLFRPLSFDRDFHAGTPDTSSKGRYGTYAIAKGMGFSEAEANRIARMDEGIDTNQTPYGRTSFSPLDEMDRHFNLAAKGQEDSRLVWAQRHLQAAIAFGKQTAYNQAEVELGAGLHSLQDLFAHGQLTPSTHATIGEFPDDVTYNPVAFYQATEATQAYLQAYISGITAERPASGPSLESESPPSQALPAKP